MTEDEVVAEITARAWRLGVAVLISPGEYLLLDGHKVGGYFDSTAEIPTLAVAKGGLGARWIGTLCHEYCHAQQWAEDCMAWRADLDSAWQGWVSGEKVRGIRKKIEASRELEADCERRAIRLMRELDAPVKLDDYARGANAYVHFYNVLAKTRKWYSVDRRPYLRAEVLALANPELDKDFSQTPKPLYDALMKCV